MAGEGIIRKALSAIPWRKLSLEEARALALKGEHLVEAKGAERLIGSPPGMTRAGLPELRARLDAAAREGAHGADWYDAARSANTEMSGGEPRVAQELAAGQAIYSNQATPREALGWTLAQRNRSALEGPEAAAKRGYHYGYQAKQYGDVLKGGDIEEALGPKTGPYFRSMDPTDESAHAIGVNDQWTGRLYGYPERSSGYSESEHSFMTGENLLAEKRAREAGVLPEGTSEGVAPWQAAAWTGQRQRALLAKNPALAQLPEGELERRAKASIPEAMEGFTAQETTEQVPSRASKHLEGAVDLPLSEKDKLTAALRASKPGEPDPYYKAMGMAQRPSAEGLGQFTEKLPDDGPLRFQPAFKRADTDEVKGVVGFHDMTQVPESWVDALDDAGNGIEAGFIDQRGNFYTREQAAAAIRGVERDADAAEAANFPSRKPLRNAQGESLPYIGSAERAEYEQQYRKNVEAMRGVGGDVQFREAMLPIDQLETSHNVGTSSKLDPRTRLYVRGYKEGAPPNRLLVYKNESGTYSILDGNRRLGAAQAAGLREVPVLIEEPKGPAEKLTSERLTTRETHFGQEAQTKTDYNPNQTMRPMVSFAPGSTAKPELDPAAEEMLRGVNTLRSAVDVQAAGAVHIVKPATQPSLQNAARIAFPEPLDREMTSILYEQAQGAGLSLIDTGGGNFTLTGDFGQLPAAEFKKRAKDILAQLEENGARIRLGKYIGQYNELPQYGEGRVTQHLLENVSPRVGAKLSTPELKAHWLEKNAAETALSQRLGLGAPREDVHRLRALLGKGGVEGLRKHVKKAGLGGLPALAAYEGSDRE